MSDILEEDGITVLFVDDEDNILRSLTRLMMDEDFEVETATSGEAALEKLKTLKNVGLIVSDQRMPGMNGAEFLGRSQEFAPNAQRILLTGYSDINATIDAINKGGAGRYISKPWDDEELLAAVRDALKLYGESVEKLRLNDIIAKQKQELEEWNDSLKKRLLQTTATIREQNQAIKSINDKTPLVLLSQVFDNMYEAMGDRHSIHSRTVSILVTDAARNLGLDPETVASYRLAALLHDAGKLGISATYSLKQPDELSEAELTAYREHPSRGAEMFKKVEEMHSILDAIKHHHEAYNGKGFPDGLVGEDIPLGARLIAIADHIEKSARIATSSKAGYALMNARFHADELLDSKLIASFSVITKIVYHEKTNSGLLSENEVTPEDLLPGMVVVRDVESGSGVLLIQRGTVLDAAGISLIRSQYRKNPPKHGVVVQVVEA